MTIHEKLIKVQSSLNVPKGQLNKFGGYKYRSCEDILEALKPLLKENGLVLTLSDTIEMIGGRFYVKATASITAVDKPGAEPYSVTAYAREEEIKKGMDGSQITGAASSYARKYALNGLFCIDDTKDSDATNKHDDKPPRTKQYPPADDPGELARLKAEIWNLCGQDLDKVTAASKAAGVEGGIKTTAQAKKVLGSLVDK